MEGETQTLHSQERESSEKELASNSEAEPTVIHGHENLNYESSISLNLDVSQYPCSERSVHLYHAVKSESSVALGDGATCRMINAAVKLQKVYKGHRIRRMLADSAVVAEELWWQAMEFARLKHSTISFFNFLKPETTASRWNRIGLNASKVGKGLSKDAKARKLAFEHWIEAIDPRHRYGHSLHGYYEEWRKADAAQPFFYWLDIGDGKEVDLKECPRSKLRHQCIKYLGPKEREHYEYIIVEGKFVHRQTGELLDTNKGLNGTKWIFVMSTSKKLYAGEKMRGIFHHSSFLAGGTTLAAGRLKVEDGILKSISAYSGHYCPTDENLGIFLAFLKEKGVNLDEVQLHSTDDYDYYDNKSIQERSAIEVSTNSKPLRLEICNEVEKYLPSKPNEVGQTESIGSLKRISSVDRQSPRVEVPEKAILQRINSKKAASSYQLGHQLSLKWSTGAGPRIGCVTDYPLELREQAMEFVNLSPRISRTPPAFEQLPSVLLSGYMPILFKAREATYDVLHSERPTTKYILHPVVLPYFP